MTSNGDGGGGEIVHISLGSTANFITSHLLNLQGLAATTSSSPSPRDDCHYHGLHLHPDRESSLCDPSVTHACISSSSSSSSSSSRMYVPRTLIVDGRDSFGTPWGGVEAASKIKSVVQSSSSDIATTLSTWSGAVSLFDPSKSLSGENNDANTTINDDDPRMPPRQQPKQRQHQPRCDNPESDPLHKFREAASLVGISMQHSRFRVTSSSAAAVAPYSSYNANNGVDYNDDDEEEEEEEELDDYDRERRQRQLQTMHNQNRMKEKEWNALMESSWEEVFYGSGSIAGAVATAKDDRQHSDSIVSGRKIGVSSDNYNDDTRGSKTKATSTTTTTTTTATTTPISNEREIQWYDYWMPPRPRVSDYQVPLPFDSSSTPFTSSLWSTSFNRGYISTSSGGGVGVGEGGGGGGGGGGHGSDGSITNSWREHVLSEKLRRVLESSDVVKGFNVFVDGGIGIPTSTAGNAGTALVGGGGFHAGLAASLLEELSEECRSAGRWAIMVDPPAYHCSLSGKDENNGNSPGGDHSTNRFRQRLNAGLALHGLTTTADVFLPLSMENAHHALYHDSAGDYAKGILSSPNRVLFEGSAAISLALEASTLFYRLRRNQQNTHAVGDRSRYGGIGSTRRSRIGIQSGYYQGYGGSSSNGYEECDNEPYATSPSMTYHEFLACLRPSSDSRRSVLELDTLLHPVSYPLDAGGGVGSIAGGGLNVGNALSPSFLSSLTSSGLVGNFNSTGELHRRMVRGTSLELMMLEQRGQQYRSSRGKSSTMPSKPGEWLDDISTKTMDGGGMLSSLSGNNTPFGRRSDHRHFALSTSLRPSDSDSRSVSSSGINAINVGSDCVSSFLRPMMESMGSDYRPEVSSGLVVKDSVVELTELGSYWRSIFSDRRSLHDKASRLSPSERASLTPVLSVLGNSTRSYKRLKSISTGIIDALQSRCNMGYLSRDVMSGLIPEKDDCEEALEYCRELVDVYEPPMGSGLVSGDDENYALNAYFDESD